MKYSYSYSSPLAITILLLLLVVVTQVSNVDAFLPRGKTNVASSQKQHTKSNSNNSNNNRKKNILSKATQKSMTNTAVSKRSQRQQQRQRRRQELLSIHATPTSDDDDETISKETSSSTSEEKTSTLETSSGPTLKAGALDPSKLKKALKKLWTDIKEYRLGQVWQNLQDGEWGQRGEVYFVSQMVLIGCILWGGLPLIGGPLRFLAGPSLVVAGLIVLVYSVVDLGSASLSPFPKPATQAQLQTTGLYAQVRHPMYAGLLSVLSGISLVTNSGDRVLLTAILWYLLEIKSNKEEAFLEETYGQAYLDYKEQVPDKFLPKSIRELLPWLKE